MNMGVEIALNMESLLPSSSSSSSSSSSNFLCKICLEGEEESSKSMETPCGCSGTLKFAHRDCIQKWCDEKGDTICEICLQNFEPDYATAAPKKTEWATRRDNQELHHHGLREIAVGEDNEFLDIDHDQFTPMSKKLLQFVAIMLSTTLLVGHFMSVFGGEDESALINFMVLTLEVAGILVPLYLIWRAIRGLQRYWVLRHPHFGYDSEDDDVYAFFERWRG